MAFEAWGNYADKVPYTFMVIKEMQEQTIKTHPFLCVLTWARTLLGYIGESNSKTYKKTTSRDPVTGITIARTFISNKTVMLQGLSLPELSTT